MTIDWKLVSNEIQIYRRYACLDDKPGLSLREVAELHKKQPTLFHDALESYRRLEPSASDPSPVRLFHDHYLRAGGVHLLKAVGLGVRRALNLPPAKGAPAVHEPDPSLRLDSLGFFQIFAGKRPEESELARMKSSLLEFFREQKAPLLPSELQLGTRQIPFSEGTAFAYTINFFPATRCLSAEMPNS
ncbi:MAG TPA: hypothetical protein VJR29_02060 [bacterium]|nr:hypothetical protein [bacterium]